MNRKQQRRMDSVQNVTNLPDIEREINRTEMRISSARDSINDFKLVFTFALLIGGTIIGTAAWYAQPLAAASWMALKASLAVFSFFSLYTVWFIWLSIGPDEDYRNSLGQQKAKMAPLHQQIVQRVQTVPAAAPKVQEVEFQ
jgi:hypothetical protein